MEERKYKVTWEDEIIARDMRIDDALIFIKALCDKYFNNRIIKQITVEDSKATDVLFEQLMGQGVTSRKAYIKEHSEEAKYNAE